MGSTITANTQQLLIKDNTLTLNYGETGGTVTKGIAGLEIDRGTGDTYTILFQESDDTFRVGVTGNTQVVATREDNPISNGIAIWNPLEYRFDTTLDLNATTISATTYYGLPTDIQVTGGTYSNGTTTYRNNTGGTFTVTGLTTPFTGGTIAGGLVTPSVSATTISATTYVGLPTDVRVTGGTYNAGTATFTNNTGGTFVVTGFSTSTATAFTGGTVTGGTIFTNGITANTISATTYYNLPITPGCVEVSFASQTAVTITHSLGYKPEVQTIDENRAVFIPYSIIHDISSNAFTIIFNPIKSGSIIYTVNGSGGSLGGSSMTKEQIWLLT